MMPALISSPPHVCRPFSWFITWIQFLCYSTMSYIEMHLRGVKRVTGLHSSSGDPR